MIYGDVNGDGIADLAIQGLVVEGGGPLPLAGASTCRKEADERKGRADRWCSD